MRFFYVLLIDVPYVISFFSFCLCAFCHEVFFLLFAVPKLCKFEFEFLSSNVLFFTMVALASSTDSKEKMSCQLVRSVGENITFENERILSPNNNNHNDEIKEYRFSPVSPSAGTYCSGPSTSVDARSFR